MKNRTSYLIPVICILIGAIFPGKNFAQSGGYENSELENSSGEFRGPCVSETEKHVIKARIEQFEDILEMEGKLDVNRTASVGPHAFIWPLVVDEENRQFSYFNIGNYVDNNATSSGLPASNPNETLQDYNCGNRTYDDANGYDHSGIDIGIGPFAWKMMDDEVVSVIAAEGGYIADILDNEWDRNCQTPSPNVYHGNYVVLTHSDGSTTWYMHMKSGTVTNKSIGDYVNVGEYLGKVGSSGNSTGPHLHFEVHDDNGNVLDPFQNGNCSTGLHPSLWADEEPYYNKKIVSISTMSTNSTNSACSTNVSPSHGYSEIVSYRNHFSPGDTIWISSAFRDITQNMTVVTKIYSPTGALLYTYQTYTELSSYSSLRGLTAWYYPAPSTTGTYKVQCTYGGVTRAHYFTVNCPPSATLSGTRSSNYGYISGGSITSTDDIAASAQNVKYQAETYIKLSPGFTALSGCEFHAFIDDCTIGSTRLYEVGKTINDKWDLHISPNPASDNITLSILNAAKYMKYEVQILSSIGNLIYQSEINENEILVSLDKLSDGIYFVKVLEIGNGSSDKSIITKKLLITH